VSRIAVLGSAIQSDLTCAALAEADLECAVCGSPRQLAGDGIGLVVVFGADQVAACRRHVVAGCPILAVIDSEDEAIRALDAGATDVVASGIGPILVARARNLFSGRESDVLGRAVTAVHEALIEVQQELSSGGEDPDSLRRALDIAREVMGFERASLVANIEASDRGFVIAATDDPGLSQLSLGIWNYPEIRESVRNEEPVLIADALEHPITSEVANRLKESGVRAIAVIPVLWRRRALGAVVFRKNTPGIDHITGPKMGFAYLFASRVAANLRDSTIIQNLRDQTHRISRASYEAERRLRTVESLKEHFEAAADGVFVVGDDGRLMFVNRVAETITGFARDALVGAPLAELVLDDEQESLEDAMRCVLGGHNVEAFDLSLSTTSGQPVCVSVTTSTVLAKSGAVILSFREVTQERALETELRKTKEFLEKLIDSTVDAIIAADTRGTVILFNAGAERMFGYRAADAVGQLQVQELYPEGVPQQIMRMLRSDAHGGVGHLEQTRREVLSKSGELVPVNMTASIIYEGDQEVATVGIFSDLRERIRIEQRLLKAQEKLEVSEKKALVAQLAGTAAHELNQPLTSIMGYAQLVARQVEAGGAGARAIDIILQEAERMAEIVRKIGRITRFETKEYVGSTSIIDLDKSAPNPPSFGGSESSEEAPVAAGKGGPGGLGRRRERVSAAKQTMKIPVLTGLDDEGGGKPG